MARLKIGLIALLTALTIGPAAIAQRPSAMRLFPGRTVFFVRMADFATTKTQFAESEFFQDPEIRPFLVKLFGEADASFRDSGATGMSLGDSFDFLQGEVAFGVIARSNEDPAILLLADCLSSEQREAGDPLVSSNAEEQFEERFAQFCELREGDGFTLATETVGPAQATVFRRGDDQRIVNAVVQHRGVVLFSNDKLILESVLTKWSAAEGEPVVEPTLPADADEAKRVRRARRRYADSLADNEDFAEAIRQCAEQRVGGGDSSPPGLIGFADPVGIFRSIAQRNAGMRVALATLPILGLDGVRGAAGSMWMDHGEWDTLVRAHLLLDNPRAGVLKLLRLTPVNTAPGDAIPADATEYVAAGVNFAATLEGAEQLYDRIRGEGEFAKLVEEQFTKRVSVSPGELLSHLTGRVVSVQAYGETPEGQVPRISPSRAVLLSVDDPEWAVATIERVFKQFRGEPEWLEHAGTRYLPLVATQEPEGLNDEDRQRWRRNRRIQESTGVMTCVAVLDNQLVFSQTTPLLKKLLETHAGQHDRLAEHLPFRIAAKRAGRLGSGVVGGEAGRLLLYTDPSPQFRQWLRAGESDEAREQLDRMAQFAPPMRWLRNTLDEVDLPSEEAVLKHMAPSAGAVFDTPQGFRYVGFTFRANTE